MGKVWAGKSKFELTDGNSVIIAPADGKIWEPCQPIRSQHVLSPDKTHRRPKRRSVSETSVASQPTLGRHVATHADGVACVPTPVRIRTYPLGKRAPPVLSDYFHRSVRTSSAAVEDSCRPVRETVRRPFASARPVTTPHHVHVNRTPAGQQQG